MRGWGRGSRVGGRRSGNGGLGSGVGEFCVTIENWLPINCQCWGITGIKQSLVGAKKLPSKKLLVTAMKRYEPLAVNLAKFLTVSYKSHYAIETPSYKIDITLGLMKKQPLAKASRAAGPSNGSPRPTNTLRRKIQNKWRNKKKKNRFKLRHLKDF